MTHILRRSSYERVFDIPTQAGGNDGNSLVARVVQPLTLEHDRLGM